VVVVVVVKAGEKEKEQEKENKVVVVWLTGRFTVVAVTNEGRTIWTSKSGAFLARKRRANRRCL
jgi:5-deoxy-D-glucuronate isomerase